MKYNCLHIQSSFGEEWQKDVFEQEICDLGVDTIDDGKYYIPSSVWAENADKIERLCASTEGVSFVRAEECPDENWNSVWESEHPVMELPLGVKIVPHCAFGAGHHETTGMMIDALIAHQYDFVNKHFANVLDHGTGTGVLAIYAKRLGAQNVVAVDIDDKSVANAKENAALNNTAIEVSLGESVPEGQYDLILANIHRNVLISNMEAYSTHLHSGGELWLSGFYEEDCAALIRSAEECHLQHCATHEKGEWRMLVFRA